MQNLVDETTYVRTLATVIIVSYLLLVGKQLLAAAQLTRTVRLINRMPPHARLRRFMSSSTYVSRLVASRSVRNH